jgi:hypothetical protein
LASLKKQKGIVALAASAKVALPLAVQSMTDLA